MMLIATQRIRVEWAHCDPARIIFNPNYYIWMDQGTHALLQAAGFDLISEVRDNKSFRGCPLVTSKMDFVRPLYFGDRVTLSSQVTRFGNKSFDVRHEFRKTDDNNLVAVGVEIRVWGSSHPENSEKLIACSVPANVREMLSVSKTVDVTP